MEPKETAIQKELVGKVIWQLLGHSIKKGGLGIPDPTMLAGHCHETSVQASSCLVELLLEGGGGRCTTSTIARVFEQRVQT